MCFCSTGGTILIPTAWNIIEGEKVVNYRIVDCPVCKKAQKINNKLLLGHNILEIRCPWCLETMLYDASFIVGVQYHVENIEE